jgi:alpha-1,3-rhamnosyl/mannosyltransferase
MARGVPVACSDAASLPEVAGGATLLFHPGEPQSIAASIDRVLADERLRDELRARGRERAARFTWQATARETLAVYRRALDGRGSTR